MNNLKVTSKRGQIWIETVIYTLIALVMIGLVLSFMKPNLEKLSDQTTISNSINMFGEIHGLVLSIREVPGNQRLIDLNIKNGVVNIDGKNDKLTFEIESDSAYSEIGKDVYYGDVVANTQKIGGAHLLTLRLDYQNDYNVTYSGEDILKSLTKSQVPYRVLISNKGQSGSKIAMNFEVI
ncbi:MAG: hypothetical protein AABX88_03135 [Nanoarchaeota archaeon]